MLNENDVLDLKNLKRRFFYTHQNKSKILCVVDDYFSTTHKKIMSLIPHLSEFIVDVYSECDLEKINDFSCFDAIWAFGTPISKKYKNKNKTIIATCFNELFSDCDFYNSISCNNPEICTEKIFKTYDFVDLIEYGHDVLIERRNFKVLVFDDSFKDKLKESSIEFLDYKQEKLKDPNDLYNECCLLLDFRSVLDSRILEASACGVVSVTNNSGYCKYIKNKIVCENESDAISKILNLKFKPKNLYNISKSISKEMLFWDIKKISYQYEIFLNETVNKNSRFLFV
jgi:hypothetical protein